MISHMMIFPMAKIIILDKASIMYTFTNITNMSIWGFTARILKDFIDELKKFNL